MTKNIVFYHDKCTDGFGAAFAAYLKLGQETIYIPVNYKPIQDMEPLEALEYVFKDMRITAQDYASFCIFVVDYSFPVDHYKVHRKLFKQIVIIDHHKSAIDSYLPFIKEELYNDEHILENKKIAYSIYTKDSSTIIFSSSKSGALLSYIKLIGKEIPLVFEMISDRDLWTFKYADLSRALHLYLESIKPWSFEQWRELLDDDVTRQSVVIGMALLEDRNALLASYAEKAIPIVIQIGEEFHRGATVQAPAHLCSGVGELIYNAGHDYALIYSIIEQGYGCSLRSKGEYSVEAIAKHFGGGGHLNAAGCTIEKELFESFLSKGLSNEPTNY